MSEGGGQSVVFALSGLPNFKLYHYTDAGGSTTLKNIYSDEDLQTTMAQPAVADANGVIQFWGHGDYRFLIKNSLDVEQHDWDPVHVSQGQSVILNYDTSLGAANAANKGMLKGKIDGANVIRELGMSNGTLWVSIYEANANGEQIFDSVITKDMPVYNVRHSDYGALADGSDDLARIQLAIAAIEASSLGGVLYFPAGQYNISGALEITDTNIIIIGDGPGLTTIYQTGAANGFTISQASHAYRVMIRDLTLLTEDTTAAGNAINATWASGAITRNFALYNVNMAPAGVGSDYWNKGVVLNTPFSPIIEGLSFSGRSITTDAADAIEITAADGVIYVDSNYLVYANSGVSIIGASEPAIITGNTIDYVNVGVELAPSSTKNGFIATDNRISSITRGITLSKVTDSNISNNVLIKHSSSSEDYYGVELIDACDDTNVVANNIRDNGTGGVFFGAVHTSGDDCKYDANSIKGGSSAALKGIQIDANQTGFDITNNRISGVDTGVQVTAGTSDDYTIIGNNLVGCTTGLTDNGTGTNKIVTDNLNVGASGTITTETTEVSTTDATVTTLWSKTLGAAIAYIIIADVIAINTTTGVAVVGATQKAVIDDGALRDNTPDYYYEQGASFAVDIDLSGGDARLRVTGAAATNVNWKASVRILEVA